MCALQNKQILPSFRSRLFPSIAILLLHVMYSISFHYTECHLLPFIFILFYSIPSVKADISLLPLWLVTASNILIGLKVGVNIGRTPKSGGPAFGHPLRFTHTHKGRPLRLMEEFTIEQAQVCHSQWVIIACCKPTDMY